MPKVLMMFAGLLLTAGALAQPTAPPAMPAPKVAPAPGISAKPAVTSQQLESIKKQAQAQTGKQSGPQLDQELNRRAQSQGFPNWQAMEKAARP